VQNAVLERSPVISIKCHTQFDCGRIEKTFGSAKIDLALKGVVNGR
jgi:hypothetical protein